jgi:sortase A
MNRAGNLLLLIGSALLVWCSVVWTGTALFDWYEARALTQLRSQGAASEGAPGTDSRAASPIAPTAPHAHDVIGRLAIPRLHVSAVVLEGDDDGALTFGAGHVPWTPLPAHPGNVGIAAHRDTVFRRLRDIALRDDIQFTTPQGCYHYRVTSTEIVRPQDTGVLDSSGGQELTLVTCYPFAYIGPAPLRFIVHARRT